MTIRPWTSSGRNGIGGAGMTVAMVESSSGGAPGGGAEAAAGAGGDPRGERVVDRQAVLPDEIPDPAAERDPADPDRAGVAEAHGEPVLGRRGRDLGGGEAGRGPGGPCLGVDLQALQVPEADDQAVVDGAVGRPAVAAR